MASSLGTLAMLNVKSFSIKSSKNRRPCKPTVKTVSLLSQKDLPMSFTSSETMTNTETSSSPSRTATITGTIMSTLISCDPAFGAQRIADVAEGDNRALALLLPIIPAILWVLYNILGPALNQINRMQSEKGVTSRKGK